MVLVKRLHSNTSVSMQASTTVEIKFNYQLHFREYHFLQETTELIIRLNHSPYRIFIFTNFL